MGNTLKNGILLIVIFLLSSCTGVTQKATSTDYSKESYLHYILAVEAQQEYNWEDALKHLKNALKEDPGSAYLKTEMSQIYLRMDRREDAVKTAEEVIDKKPDYEPALSLLARLYADQKNYQKAIDMYLKIQ